MSSKFDEASKLWAASTLRGYGINFNTVETVHFEVQHESCYCDEYCYCTRDDNVEVTILYKIAGIAQTRHVSFVRELGELLEEVMEW